MPMQLVEEINTSQTLQENIFLVIFYTSTDRYGCYLAVDVYHKGFISYWDG
jgi:hypothetical protein